MRLRLKTGEHIRLENDSGNAFRVHLDEREIHITAVESPAHEIIVAAHEEEGEIKWTDLRGA